MHSVETGVEASISVFKKGEKVAHLTQAQGTLKERALALVDVLGWSPGTSILLYYQSFIVL